MKKIFWTENKINFIRCNLNLSDSEIGEYFNVSAQTIKTVRKRHGIARFIRKPFTPDEDKLLKKLYSDTLTAVIAEKLNRSERSVFNRAQYLGLRKSKEFIKSIGFQQGSEVGKRYRFSKGHTPANKGKKMPPKVKEKIKHTFFKKGHKPHNTKANGCISVHMDRRTGIQYKYIRISENNWKELHRYIYEKEHGPIPQGFNVVFKDGNALNCNIENLELMSNAELMRRNTIHRFTPEVKQTIRLLGKLNRTIKKVSHGTE